MNKYYLDTSIWLDLLEDRNEPNFPKSSIVEKFLKKIILNDEKIIYSDVVLCELSFLGYSFEEFKRYVGVSRKIMIFVESTRKQLGKAKDLAQKRNLPKKDALHALIARDNKSIMVSFDNHFKKLKDVVTVKTPSDFI